jgi:hypothetical protein
MSRVPGVGRRVCKEASERAGVLVAATIAWIDGRIFDFAKTEGWSDALSYYAVRDPRMGKLFARWQRCDVAWRTAGPTVLPDFAEWRRAAL